MGNNSENLKQRKQAAVLGALVADAASLGFHWLYDLDRVAELGGDSPEFREPNEADYEGVAGYFAAAGKKSGEASHYGAQLKVALDTLAEGDGQWKLGRYQERFCSVFGPGGAFSGYIDGATSGTLANVERSRRELMERALGSVGGLTEKQAGYIGKYVVKKATHLEGEELEDAVASMLGIVFKEPEVLEKARAVSRFYGANLSFRNGADDNQLPAVAKLPVVVSHFLNAPDFDERVEDAIRVTNNNEQAVSYGLYAARVLRSVLRGSSIPDALEAACSELSDGEVKSKVREALDSEESLGESAKRFGTACPLPSALPLSVAILKAEQDFQTGVRHNILASGDNAGRAIWIGAVLGARHGIGGNQGIPWSWVGRLQGLPPLLNALEAL